MAWNRTTEPAKPVKKSPSATRGVVAGVIVLGIVAAAVLLLLPDNKAAKGSAEKKPTMIKEVKPTTAPKEIAAEKEKPDAKPKELPPQKVGEVRNGYVLLPSGRLHRRLGVITNNMNSAQYKLPYEIFDHFCENEIACLLELPPGENLIGTPIYNGRFKAEFLESLKHPIVIKDTDSDYVKDLKRRVIDTKIEMKAALDRGEDIEKMMLDARDEAQRLAMYKMQIENDANDLIKNGAETEQDVEDCIKAMNKMLEAKGIAPADVGIIMKRKLKRLILEKGKNKK